MYKASKNEFLNNVNKNMGDYVRGPNGEKMVFVYGPFVVELYKNIMSSYRRRNTKGRKGAISIWEKIGDEEYTVIASHVFSGIDSDTKNAKDGLSDAKNVFIDIRSNPQSEINSFIQQYKL